MTQSESPTWAAEIHLLEPSAAESQAATGRKAELEAELELSPGVVMWDAGVSSCGLVTVPTKALTGLMAEAAAQASGLGQEDLRPHRSGLWAFSRVLHHLWSFCVASSLSVCFSLSVSRHVQ